MKGEKEQWRDVIGYEGFYEVSSRGKVRSMPREIMRKNGKLQTFRKTRLLKHGPTRKRDYVCLYRLDGGGKPNYRTIHSLMAEVGFETSFVRKNGILLTFAGRTQSQSAWARELGIWKGVLSYRRKRGWTVAKTLTTPTRRQIGS